MGRLIRDHHPLLERMPVGLLYPIYDEPQGFIDRVVLRLRFTPGWCPVCGRLTIMGPWQNNLRESGLCYHCHSYNRQRQIAYILCASVYERIGFPARSLGDIRKHCSLTLYNTEASGALHNHLSDRKANPSYHYICSEYFGPQYTSGEVVNGIRHEDLTRLSFSDDSFDFVVSSDVLEHIPSPYKPMEEILRVLKPGGRHIFTVPFHQTEFLDEVLVDDNGRFLKQAIFHFDPLRPEGIPVYTIFSLEMLVRLRHIGFHTRMYRLYKPLLGILGPNAIVFEAIKIA